LNLQLYQRVRCPPGSTSTHSNHLSYLLVEYFGEIIKIRPIVIDEATI